VQFIVWIMLRGARKDEARTNVLRKIDSKPYMS
jgi:hypothetical protein